MDNERFVTNFKRDELIEKYIRIARDINSYYGEEFMVIMDIAYKRTSGVVEPGYNALFYVGPISFESEVLQRFWNIYHDRK